MAEGNPNETLISFVSGHYKKINGKWAGDSVWSHFKKVSGGMVHVNKDKVEYVETFEEPKSEKDPNDLRMFGCDAMNVKEPKRLKE